MNFFVFRYFIVIAFVATFSYTVKGQQELDLQRIEQLIKQKTDSIRKQRKRLVFVNDTVLIEAARFHVSYMKNKRTFSHNERNRKMKTPWHRVHHFTQKQYAYVGENIGYIYNEGNLSEEEIAEKLVENWRRSKGHYKNMISKDYKRIGIAVTLDESQNKILAVQVFGTILSEE